MILCDECCRQLSANDDRVYYGEGGARCPAGTGCRSFPARLVVEEGHLCADGGAGVIAATDDSADASHPYAGDVLTETARRWNVYAGLVDALRWITDCGDGCPTPLDMLRAMRARARAALARDY